MIPSREYTKRKVSKPLDHCLNSENDCCCHESQMKKLCLVFVMVRLLNFICILSDIGFRTGNTLCELIVMDYPQGVIVKRY